MAIVVIQRKGSECPLASDRVAKTLQTARPLAAEANRLTQKDLKESGEPPRNRTENPQIKSLLLCQLS